MNAQEFKQKTGRDPVQDDLQRANCDKAGTVGHADCGVCAFCGIPNWLCFGHSIKEVNSRIASLEEDKRKLIEALKCDYRVNCSCESCVTIRSMIFELSK